MSGEDQAGTKLDNQTALLLDTVSSGKGTYILSLTNFRGAYFVTVSSQASVNVTVTLFNKELTHLIPHKQQLFDKEGVYQLFTNQQNVLVEVFNCQGDFLLLASKSLKDTQLLARDKDSPITLRRPNYAGHYVLGVEGIFGSYYLRVNSKATSQSQVEYLISYSYYSEVNPYDMLDAKNYELGFDESSSGIMVKFHELGLVEEGLNQLTIKTISYFVYASHTQADLRRYSRCNIIGSVVEKRVAEGKDKVYLDVSISLCRPSCWSP